MKLVSLIAAMAVILSAAAAVSAACVGEYDQCGGKSWTGPTCCVRGYECKKINEWYSQCQEKVPPSPPQCIQKWMQCGGTGFPTPKCCQNGYKCKFYSPTYGQCVDIRYNS
jgi:Fungal cellulose binding domain